MGLGFQALEFFYRWGLRNVLWRCRLLLKGGADGRFHGLLIFRLKSAGLRWLGFPTLKVSHTELDVESCPKEPGDAALESLPSKKGLAA